MIMVKITVDESLRDQLDAVRDPIELCDSSGQTLGHFVPSPNRPGMVASIDCPYPDESLIRMRRESGGRGLAEIWKDLGRP